MGRGFERKCWNEWRGGWGEHHAGDVKRASAEVRAERLIAEELRRLGWTEAELRGRRKSDPDKLAMASRLRRETTLTVGWIAQRLALGTRKSAVMKLHRWSKEHPPSLPQRGRTMV